MKVPITKPYFTEEEYRLVRESLDSGWIVQGPFIKELEKRFCEYTKAEYAVAMNSCTSAQFIASRCIGLDKKDEVIVPAFTWISTANAVEFLGAKIVFADIDLETFNIAPERIEEKITEKTKAIFPVNLFGLPAQLNKIKSIASKHGLNIIEDCACSLGGWLDGKHTGRYGDCGCFSMHPRKSITTGEGGMLITDSSEIAGMAMSLRNHGAVVTDMDRHDSSTGFLLSEYEEMGYNYRLTDIQGALGVAQFKKLGYILERKRELAGIYDSELENVSFIKTPSVISGASHGYQSYVCLFKPDEIQKVFGNRCYDNIEKLHLERNKLMAKLNEKGIATRQGTHTVHIQKYYMEKYSIDGWDYPNSYIADRLSIALPIYPQMTEEEQRYVIDGIKECAV